MVLKFTKLFKVKSSQRFSFVLSQKISRRTKVLIRKCGLSYIKPGHIFFVESSGSKSKASARIWGLPRLWQRILRTPPAYVIEALPNFFKLSKVEQDRVLLHELAHIPKNFSGALVGHNGIGKRVKLIERNLKDKISKV